jgi:hypothetical protein
MKKERIKGLKRKRQRQEDKKKGQEDKKVLTIKMVVLSNVCYVYIVAFMKL